MAANIATQKDTDNNVSAILASFPFAALVAFISISTMTTRPAKPTPAFSMSPQDIPDINLATTDNISIEPDMANNILLIFASFPLARLVANINVVIIPTNPNSPIAAFNISPQDILANILATIANIAIALDNFIRESAVCSIFFPEIFPIRTNNVIIPTSPAIPAPALPKSPQDIPPIILRTMDIINKDVDNFNNNELTESMDLGPTPFGRSRSLLRATIIAIKDTIINVNNPAVCIT